ncbi:MAG: hypothetical protein A2W11_12220 [Ignavibacteria bacterium RBG_16_35_7]|nr:MAG: hypothetical protein A2W11_12220 [Ignavibacteria bacterium RBG_16_35_7]
MYKSFQIFLFFFLSAQICFGQWNQQNSGITFGLKDVTFASENKAFMFGGYGGGHGDGWWGEQTIFATSNGGSEWDIKLVIHCLWSFCYLQNDSVGFVIHDRPWLYGDTIFKTTDFGDSWIDVTPVWGFRANDIIFQNDMTGYMVGDKIYKTTDYGNSWYVDYTDSLEGYFLNSISLASTTIWAVGEGGTIIKYAAQTGWVKQPYVTNLPLTKVIFLDDNNGWIAGSLFLRTTNGGIKWDTIPGIPYLIRDMEFIDNSIGWAVGYTNTGEGGILKTIDGGLTWDLQMRVTGNSLSGIFFLDANNGWAVGDSGIILHTTNGGNPVPVELNLFTATANGKEVILNWSTATELNNQGFEVQRKFGSNDFVTIGSVKGHGTTTSPNNYTYVDKLLSSGKYFYRLKQIDFGGKYEYSQTVEVNWSPFTTYKLEQNYPNPFNPKTTIGFGIPEKGNVRLSVLNILGEEIKILPKILK